MAKILHQEGLIQGNPAAIGTYFTIILPLVKVLQIIIKVLCQSCFVNDSAATISLQKWENLQSS